MRGGIGTEALEEVEALLSKRLPQTVHIGGLWILLFVSHPGPLSFICLAGLVAVGSFRLFRSLFLFYPIFGFLL